MFLQNSLTYSRRVVTLLLLFTSSLIASHNTIYNTHNPNFKYSLENGNYKVYLSNESSINYLVSDGFKLFLPNFVKEYNLDILRFNSIGKIDGYLSLDKNFNTTDIIDTMRNDIRYYTTDYKTKKQRQLSILLKNKVIPYDAETSISIEGYNIPKRINQKLNKWIYFTFDKKDIETNKLKSLLYSFYMILDKKQVDKYVKKRFKTQHLMKDRKFDYLNTFIVNLHKFKEDTPIKNSNIVVKKKTHQMVISKKVPQRRVIRLNLKRFLYMKEFGSVNEVRYIKTKNEKYDELYNLIKEVQNKVEDTKISYGYIDSIKNYEKYQKQAKKFRSLSNTIENKLYDIDSMIENIDKSCSDFGKNFDKKCLNDDVYTTNYIYNKIKEKKLPEEELILGFGNGKIFNDIAKYYFELGEYDKSEQYLYKAYILLSGDEKKLVSYNLGVLYGTKNGMEDNVKSVKYFKETDFKEAYFNLGVNYYIGLGVNENDKKAFDYFQKASKDGLERAENNLVKMKQKFNIKKLSR